MDLLKQSTAVVVPFGPFLDVTDGKTPETALSSQTGRIFKHGAVAATFTPASWSHQWKGKYNVGLSTSHTDTLGLLEIFFYDETTYMYVQRPFMVVPANVYDSLCGSDRLQVDTREMGDASLALTSQMKTDVNAQVVDTLNTDTYGEPGQEAPPATTTLVKKIGYLFKFMRNKVTNDGSNIKVYDDGGSTVDQKSGVSEAAGTVTRGAFGTGP